MLMKLKRNMEKSPCVNHTNTNNNNNNNNRNNQIHNREWILGK